MIRIAQVSCVLVIGFLIRIALIQSVGYRDDMKTFNAWFTSILGSAPSQVYTQTPGLAYPPGYAALIELSAGIMRLFVRGTPTTYELNVTLKLMPIAFDIAGAAIAYVVVRRAAGHAFGLLAAAYIAFNPAIIYDSAYWGQIDSVPAVLAFFAIAVLWSGNVVAAWPALAFAALVKPPVIVLAPLLVLYPLTRPRTQWPRAFAWTAVGAAAAFLLVEALAVRFFSHPAASAALGNLAARLLHDSSPSFEVTSFNAFNLWALFHPFNVPDTTMFFSLSMHVLGTLLFLAMAALICVRYVANRSPSALFEAAVLLLLAFFLFPTAIHERYLFYAVVFVSALVFKRSYRSAGLILSLTLLLNLEYAVTYMYLNDAHTTIVDRFEFAPWLIHLCAAANLGVFAWLFVEFFGREPFPSAWREWLRRQFSSAT